MEKNSALSVAVVDDDQSLCRALLRLLRAEGFCAQAYYSAEAFLADQARPDFDCLLLDVQMGGMSGLELQQQLKASGTAQPVIFITALNEPGYREQAERAGCAAYLHKNDPGASVLAAIRQAAAVRPSTTAPA